MHIKRFEGSTLAELLEKIRTELGEDALILETRTGKRGRVEVLAARPHAGAGNTAFDPGAEDVGQAARMRRNGSDAAAFGADPEEVTAPPPMRPHAQRADEPAGHQVLAQGAANAYARHGGARSGRASETSSILRGEPAPTQTPIPAHEQDSASRSGSGGAISRVAQILSRKPKAERSPNRGTAADETFLTQSDSRAATSSGPFGGMAATSSAPVRDMEEWRAAANAALRASGLGDRESEVQNLDDSAQQWNQDERSSTRWQDGGAASDRSIELGASYSAHDEGQQSRIEYLGRLVRSEHFSAIPLPLRELYLDLTDAEIDSNLVFQILSKMGQARMPGQFAAAPPDQILALLRKLVRTGGAVQASDPPRAIALVGPTGVGKTTTVAKIAGHAAFHLRKRVALVSTDGYRIFGAQHLASYAALMGMKFENATDTDALRQVVSRLKEDCDLLLIDTSGRSPRDPEGIAETERLLAACPDLDIHLVLAATARVRDQALALERFSNLPIQHLIFTKLDETTRRGGSFTLALKAARPVSYLGTGQEVPDDLEEATIAGLTEVIAETLQKETAHA